VALRRWTPATLALFVLVSGCAGFAAQETTPTVTPAPVPETPPPEPAGPTDFAPGLDEEGSVDPARLAAAHASVLLEESYTVNQTVIERRPNGTVMARYVTTGRFGDDPERFASVLRQADEGGDSTRVVRWFGDTDAVYRFVERDNGTEPTRSDAAEVRNGSDFRSTLTNRGPITRAFGLVPTTAREQVVREDTRFLRIATPEPTTVPPLENISVAATVSERGVVHSYRVTYEVDRNGQRIHVTVLLRYTDIGSTTVGRPAWAEESA